MEHQYNQATITFRESCDSSGYQDLSDLQKRRESVATATVVTGFIIFEDDEYVCLAQGIYRDQSLHRQWIYKPQIIAVKNNNQSNNLKVQGKKIANSSSQESAFFKPRIDC